MKSPATKTKSSTYGIKRTSVRHKSFVPYRNGTSQAKVRDIIRPHSLQTKFSIGQLGDRYEQEADAVADRVVAGLSVPAISTLSPENLQSQPIEEEEELLQPLLQRQTLEDEEEEEEHIQPKIQLQPLEEDEEELQAKEVPGKISSDVRNIDTRIGSLKKSGQLLPEQTRHYFESRFGRDFSGVRVHVDEDAKSLSKDLHARAFTVGSDIAFAQGRFAPYSHTGRELLAHELTHVVQQNKNYCSSQTQNVQRAIEFDRDIYSIADPPASLTHENLREQLEESLPGGITVTGVTTGSETERRLLNALHRISLNPDRDNSEIDMILRLGPAPAGGSPPQGQVTIRISGEGDSRSGEAVLIGLGIPGPSQVFATVAEAIQALQSTFGIGQVRNGTATWTIDELSKVHTAFGLLSSSERSALSGVDLVRETSVATPEDPDLAAHFVFSHAVSGTTVTHSAFIGVGNATFANDDRSFVGGTTASYPNSVFTIIHEVGHAVESHEERTATIPRDEAQALVNAAVELRNTASAEHEQHLDILNTAVVDANNLIDPANAALQTWVTALNNYPAAERTAAVMSFHGSLGPLLTAIGNVISITSASDVPGRLQAMDSAIGVRDQRFNAIPATHAARQDGQAVNQAFDALAAAARTAAEARLPEAAARQAMDERIAEQTAREATLAEREQELAATRDAGGTTLRLAAFVQFVNDNNITPFTDYSRTHWDSDPGEFYAEAFAVFRTDPGFLQTNYQALYDWFSAGHHL